MKKIMVFAFFVAASLMTMQNASAQTETTSMSTRGSSQDIVEGGILDRDVVLIAQAPAPWCYTSYGRYPMTVALPPGAYCQVNVYFWPYVLTGVTGY